MRNRAHKSQASGAAPEQDTGQALMSAAGAEFAEHGFGGTDSNKIARRAGFAPQTFYRWYRDKTQIFIAVYRRWQEEERSLLEAQLRARGSARAIAEAIVGQHRAHLLFRRSLRQLAVTDPEVRKARAESRMAQAQRIRAWSRRKRLGSAEIYVALLQIERFADAIAEGELADLAEPDALCMDAIERVVKGLRG